MKKIGDYRKLFEAEKDIDLKDLKVKYRSLMKEYHPDKFPGNTELRAEAEEKSKEIIEAYHFLVSIAPETVEHTREDYKKTISTAGVVDFDFENQTLKVSFGDGHAYEYFGVPHKTYVKMVNSDSYGRFLRRHIADSFLYRSVNKRVAAAEA